MGPVPFTPDLSTGIKDIDDQHRLFFMVANRVLTSDELDTNPKFAAGLIGFLGRYAHLHFSSEEQAMREAGYPDLARHTVLHRHFQNDAAEIHAAVAAGGLDRRQRARLHILVQDWLTQHIRTTDRDMAEFLRTKAAEPRLPDGAAMRTAGTIGSEYDDVVLLKGQNDMTQAEIAIRRKLRAGQ